MGEIAADLLIQLIESKHAVTDFETRHAGATAYYQGISEKLKRERRPHPRV